jgi:hypothetical protein
MVAASATLLVLVWQSITVRFNYEGNWSALYSVGNLWPLPPELSGEKIFVFRNAGYDGGFYHLVAHDPWLARGFSKYVDNPSLRWRRILVPAMAYLAAFGADERVHACYIGINLLFIFAGAFWLASYCEFHALKPVWGLAFLAIPSVLVSIDRLTVDTALASLTIGLILYACKGKYVRSLALLALCPLARETGLLLTAGRAWEQASNREWRRVALSLASMIPFLLWCFFLFRNAPQDDTHWFAPPFAGILQRTLHPLQAPITGRWVALAACLDYLALVGIWIALAFAARFALKRRFGLLESCIYTCSFAVLWLGKADIWNGAYEFGRTLSPLLILWGLQAVRLRNFWLLTPLGCALPRIFLQYEPQIRGIGRHILHH